ncbi:3-oxoacyl-ACP synthase III family protein [Parabacteroides sp. FAFU027]|uniref:3-oxoacyl-ACP synthase III family protein n=1 Tax=Parabacteroides sp. FAFU027 TaxID=2922715 RepID=UPI001FAE7D16|nr:ketoacyl-ACP synthase III [Parabacteroides sp. FAFU027]
MRKALLQFISYYLPNRILDNNMIAQEHPEWSIEKIATKTGIEQRHISDEDEFASDLAICASEKLFAEYNIDKLSVDFILLCTQSPDYFLPTTACVLQDKLGLSKKCGALDFNLGCSGYIYGLGLAKGLILSGQANKVLLVTAETYSKYIHPQDKSNKTIFGDGAAATLITSEFLKDGLNAEISEFEYGTDGSGAFDLVVKNGASRHKKDKGHDCYEEDSFIRNDSNLYMDGKAIFNFTAFTVPKLIKAVLEKNNYNLEAIDLAIFHQANEYMLNVVRTRCGIEKAKFYVNFKDAGNTVSSTIPIALKRAINDRTLTDKSTVLLAGFGVGLSMGATILKLSKND